MTPFHQSALDLSNRAAQLVEANARLMRAMEHSKQATCPAEKAAAKWDIIKAQAAMEILSDDSDLGESPTETRSQLLP
jgi:tRNA threonylcarbamoyladenosine modification (KEOPS) complex Cgi121 subunit